MFKRFQPFQIWRQYSWQILIILTIITAVIGYVGFEKFLKAQNTPNNSFDLAYLTLQLFFLESGYPGPTIPWELNLARFLAPLVAISALLETLASIFYTQLQELRISFLSDHIVISGLSDYGMNLAVGFRSSGCEVVVLTRDLESSNAFVCKELGIYILGSKGASNEILKRARAHKARAVVAIEEDDGINAQIAVHCCDLVRGNRLEPLTCFTHVVDPHLGHLLREREILGENTAAFRLQFFNISDLTARLILEKHPIPEDQGSAEKYLLIIGLGRIGEGLLVHAAQSLASCAHNRKAKLKVIVIDRKGTQRWSRLCVVYPRIASVCDITFFDLDVRSAEFNECEFLFEPQGMPRIHSTYICLGRESDSLATALVLHQRLRNYIVPVIVNVENSNGIGRILSGIDRRRSDNLRVFSLSGEIAEPEVLLSSTHEILARAIHLEYNRNLVNGLNNQEAIAWEDLSKEMKEANRLQADSFGEKLEQVSCMIVPIRDWDEKPFEFDADEVEVLAREEHERWFKSLTQQGWRYYTGAKDPNKKLHPLLLHWDELNHEQKELNRNPIRVIPKILANVGLGVLRKKARGRQTDDDPKEASARRP